MLKTIATQFRRAPFARNVSILALGTLISQCTIALGMPLLTRLYSPSDFAVLAAFSSVLGLLTVGACLRFNIAIPLPEDDATALNLVCLAIVSGAVVALAVAVPIIWAPETTANLINQPHLQPFLWAIPLAVLSGAVYDSLQYWASRRERFALISVTRVTRSFGAVGTQAFGSILPGATGLVIGQVTYNVIGVFSLAKSMVRRDGINKHPITPASLLRAATEYKKFPIYSVPEAIFNTAGLELSVLIIAAAALGPEAGFLMLTMRVLGLPMGLVGAAVSQVFLTEAAKRVRAGELVGFARQTIARLFLLGAPPLALAAAISPWGFPLVFGADWARAGTLTVWFVPMFVLQFASSPILIVLHILDKLRLALVIQICGFVLRVGAVLYAAIYTPQWITEFFAVSSALFYGALIALLLWFLGRWES